MRIAFLYNRSLDDPSHAAEDDIPARSPVVAALERLGHRVVPIACTLDLAKMRRRLIRMKPDVAFNRVESLGGSDSMMAAITLLLDSMQIPYTGNSTAALIGTASKTVVKERLVEAGWPTPRWITANGGTQFVDDGVQTAEENPPVNSQRRYIIKSDLEHASFGLGDSSIIGPCAEAHIRNSIREREKSTGRRHFAEEFIDGREFNISIMGDPPHVLPPAEIDYTSFPAGQPRIVGHGAKWDPLSFEYHNTPRQFNFSAGDLPLIRKLTSLTFASWNLFGLSGYARVDFRCDSQQRPWILEINTNPCISPDAGFAAALQQAGIGYDAGLQLILEDAIRRGPIPILPPHRHPTTVHAS
ncbi:MAG TPA: hypothetical protein VHE81_05760 [Lacipirellulaceae bacterium]|nr:hypothetical protein [Lacipirellulaceae bacterium]